MAILKEHFFFVQGTQVEHKMKGQGLMVRCIASGIVTAKGKKCISYVCLFRCVYVIHLIVSEVTY